MDAVFLIRNFADKHNLILGICSAERLSWAEERIRNKWAPFVSVGIEERINPRKTMPSANSIIVIGKSYFYSLPELPLDSRPRGQISAGAIGLDYHMVLSSLLKELAEALPGQSQVYVDTGPLWERGFAQQAGLGFMGRNGHIISAKLGSFFHIGYIMTGLSFPTYQAQTLPDQCGTCNLCITHCPGNSATRCVAYLTQKKGSLEECEKRIMGNWLYGCDICQRVCPFNKDLKGPVQPELARPLLSDVLEMSNAYFNKYYKPTAAGWRGKKNLQRNALIALQNIQRGVNNGGMEYPGPTRLNI